MPMNLAPDPHTDRDAASRDAAGQVDAAEQVEVSESSIWDTARDTLSAVFKSVTGSDQRPEAEVEEEVRETLRQPVQPSETATAAAQAAFLQVVANHAVEPSGSGKYFKEQNPHPPADGEPDADAVQTAAESETPAGPDTSGESSWIDYVLSIPDDIKIPSPLEVLGLGSDAIKETVRQAAEQEVAPRVESAPPQDRLDPLSPDDRVAEPASGQTLAAQAEEAGLITEEAADAINKGEESPADIAMDALVPLHDAEGLAQAAFAELNLMAMNLNHTGAKGEFVQKYAEAIENIGPLPEDALKPEQMAKRLKVSGWESEDTANVDARELGLPPVADPANADHDGSAARAASEADEPGESPDAAPAPSADSPARTAEPDSESSFFSMIFSGNLTVETFMEYLPEIPGIDSLGSRLQNVWETMVEMFNGLFSSFKAGEEEDAEIGRQIEAQGAEIAKAAASEIGITAADTPDYQSGGLMKTMMGPAVPDEIKIDRSYENKDDFTPDGHLSRAPGADQSHLYAATP